MLGSDDVRLLTLVGVGGVGKSRLALEVARSFTSAGALSFVDLTTVSDPQLLRRAVASSIGVTEEPGRPLMETIKDALRRRPGLLVLDNFEQIAQAAPQITEILGQCPEARALVTSRVPLDVRGEHQYHVQPLASVFAFMSSIEQPLNVQPAVPVEGFERPLRSSRENLLATSDVRGA